jgi:hypothetical protein
MALLLTNTFLSILCQVLSATEDQQRRDQMPGGTPPVTFPSHQQALHRGIDRFG